METSLKTVEQAAAEMSEYTARLTETVQAAGGSFVPNEANRGRGPSLFRLGASAVAWDWPEGTEPGHYEVGNAAGGIAAVSAALKAIAAIDADERLSDSAKESDRTKVLGEVGNKLGVYEKNLRDTEAQARTVVAEVFAAPKPDAAEVAEDREVRSWFRGLDPKEQAEVLRRVSAGEHPRVLLALRRSPVPLPPMLSDAIADAWAAERRKADPYRAATLELRMERIERANTILSHLRQVLPGARR